MKEFEDMTEKERVAAVEKRGLLRIIIFIFVMVPISTTIGWMCYYIINNNILAVLVEGILLIISIIIVSVILLNAKLQEILNKLNKL